MIPPTDHSAFEIVVEELENGGRQVTAGRYRFIDEAGLSSIRAPEWLIEDFLSQGSYAILFGAAGSFKTFIALDMALTIATGGLGSDLRWPYVSSMGPVLFVVSEGRFNFVNRIRAWEQKHNHGERVQGFVLGDPVPLASEELQPFINGACCASPTGEYKLVVLDTVGRSMAGMNENSQQDASAFTSMVERIQRELNTTVLALHHTGHNVTNRARGSSVFGADADTIIRADRQGKDYLVSLTMTKQKDAPEWEKKKFIKLSGVSLDLETKSLVAVKPGEDECPKGDKFHPTDGEKETAMNDLNEVVTSLLKSDKSKKWSQPVLAKAVATDERIEIGASQLRQSHLKKLSGDSSQPASRHYDARTKKWRYVED